MKKLIALLLALVMVLSMTACTEEGPKSTDPTSPSGETSPTGDPAEKEPLYQRDSYTGEALDVRAARDTAVATMGDAKLTNGLLQIYYWMDVYSFISNYSSYLSSYGLDINKPLDEQKANVGSWQHYFLSGALEGWHHYQALVLAAEEAGIKIAPEHQEELDKLYDDLKKKAEDGKYESVDAMIQSDAGPGCTAEDYYRYNELYYTGYSYFNEMLRRIEVTDDMIEKYFTENEASLGVNGINKKSGDSCMVRHILIEVGEEKTDADWETCRQTAQKLLDDWLAGDATEDSFSELAKEHSADPGSKEEGGMYKGLTSQTSFVQEFKDWYLEEGRKVGDYGLVKTSYGYHLMYFSGTEPIWVYYCREAVTDEEASKIITNAVEKYEMVVNYDDILLGEVKLTTTE